MLVNVSEKMTIRESAAISRTVKLYSETFQMGNQQHLQLGFASLFSPHQVHTSLSHIRTAKIVAHA